MFLSSFGITLGGFHNFQKHFFPKLHYDFESMVYVLVFIMWIHNDRTSHLTKVRKFFFQSSLCLLLETRQSFWHVFRYIFFKAQFFLTTEEQFLSEKNRRGLSLNPIVNKNEEWMSIKHSFSHSNYLPPTKLRTISQEKLVHWFFKIIYEWMFNETSTRRTFHHSVRTIFCTHYKKFFNVFPWLLPTNFQ